MGQRKKLNFIVSNLSVKDNQNQNNFYLETKIIKNFKNTLKKNNFAQELIKNKGVYEKYSNFIHKKYLKYIPILANRLNEIHDEKNCNEYWAVAFSMGLVRYITILYFFYEKYENYFSVRRHNFKILNEKNFLTPFEFEEQRHILTNSDLGREQIFSIYCRTIYSGKRLNFLGIQEQKNNFKTKNYSKIFSLVLKFINNKFLARNCKTLILGCSFNLKYQFKIFVRSFFSNVLILNVDQKKEEIKINYKNRAFLSRTENDFDKFDKFFFKSLESFFPILFLESYKNIKKDYLNVINKYPKVERVFSEQFISNSYYAFFLGICRKKNILINAVQHNGLISPFIGKYEEYIAYMCDFYYVHDINSKRRISKKYIQSSSLHSIYSVSSQRLLNIKKYEILFVMGPERITPIHFNASESGDNIFYESNIKFSLKFLTSLNFKPKSLLFYRPYPHNINGFFSNKEKELSKHFGGEKKKVSLAQPLKNHIKKSNLVIVDYISTAYIESFLLNIPTIVFLNKKTYFLKNNKLNIFSELISAGVFQTNPQSAANLINKIYLDPKKWWGEEPVKSAVTNFLEKNLNLSDKLFKQIVFFENFN